MAEAVVFSQKGEPQGRVELPAHVFGLKPHGGALHEAVRSYLDNQRQGTASTLTRADVDASSRKPWRQKGTGRARSGMRSSPIWRGGGIAFGPHPRDYGWRLPRKLRRLAVCSALSARAGEGAVLVLENLEIAEAKTRFMAEVLKSLAVQNRRTLVVLPEYNEGVYRAAGNLPGVKVRVARELCAYDVLSCEKLVLLKAALPVLEESYA